MSVVPSRRAVNTFCDQLRRWRRTWRWRASLTVCAVVFGTAWGGAASVHADVVYFTTPTGISQVVAGGTPTVFIAETGDGPNGNHLNEPIGIVADRSGNLYVSNVNNGDIVRIALDGTASIFSHADTTSWLYAGLAVDSSGNVYAAERNNGAVVEISPSGTVTTLATGIDRPFAIAVDDAGTVYSSNEDNTIVKITSAGTVSTFASALSGGLAVDRAGYLYVSAGTTIQRISPSGVADTFVSGLQDPGDIAFGSDGNLYLPDYGANAWLTISPSGAVSRYASSASANNSDYFITARPAPEPSGAIVGLVCASLWLLSR